MIVVKEFNNKVVKKNSKSYWATMFQLKSFINQYKTITDLSLFQTILVDKT